MVNYKTIKRTAKNLKIKVNELLALAPQNDPFYAGKPADIAQAEWFKELWDKAGYVSGVHLRRIHYFATAQDGLIMPTGEKYQNTDKCWKYITQAAKMARYLDYVSISDIADHKNPEPLISARYLSDNTTDYGIETPELDAPEVIIYGLARANVQPYHLEVWCEKSTMNDVLQPICEQFGANLVTFQGEVSITSVYELVQRLRLANKPARIFYISDFDPAGANMPRAMARKVEYMIGRSTLDVDIRVQSLVLTIDQVRDYRLPRIPIKESEKRAGNFEDAYGSGAVELDALEALRPGQLSRIVTEALEPYYSIEAAREIASQRRALDDAVKSRIVEITGRYKSEIEAVREMLDEITRIEIDASQYHVDTFPADVVEDDEQWLYSSKRDYVEQIKYYWAHKNNETVA